MNGARSLRIGANALSIIAMVMGWMQRDLAAFWKILNGIYRMGQPLYEW